MSLIKITVTGSRSVGKSTVLLLIAKELEKIGYCVNKPDVLVGIKIKKKKLSHEKMLNTTIRITEDNE